MRAPAFLAGLLSGWLLATAAQAAPIALFQVDPEMSFNGFTTAVVDPASLNASLQVRGVDMVTGPVSVGQTLTVSLSSGTIFDEIVALYTNGVTDAITHLFAATWGFDMSLNGGPMGPTLLGQEVLGEFADLPDLAGYVIDEFRLTSTITCWDADNTPTKDTCDPPVQVSRIQLKTSLTAEFFGHLADPNAVPEPASGALVAGSLLALAATRRRRA